LLSLLPLSCCLNPSTITQLSPLLNSANFLPCREAAATAAAPWKYHSTLNSFAAAALQPLPAPPAAPAAAFNPALPLHIDLDALLTSPNTQQLLQQGMQCDGQVLPAAAWESLLHGAVSRSLLILQRTPGMVLQLIQGERLQHVLPLFVFKSEPVRLVLLVEQLAAGSSAAEQLSAAAVGGGRVFYGGVQLAAFDDVYGAVRALGPASWVGWVGEAVEAIQRGFVRVDLAVAGAGDGVMLRLRCG
jgi:hypothetical protein